MNLLSGDVSKEHNWRDFMQRNTVSFQQEIQSFSQIEVCEENAADFEAQRDSPEFIPGLPEPCSFSRPLGL